MVTSPGENFFLLLFVRIYVWLTHSTNYLCGFQFLHAWATWGLLMTLWHVTIPAVPSRALMPLVRWWTTLWRGVDARQTLTWAINWPAVLAHCAAVTTQEVSHLQVQWSSVDANGKYKNKVKIICMLSTIFSWICVYNVCLLLQLVWKWTTSLSQNLQ